MFRAASRNGRVVGSKGKARGVNQARNNWDEVPPAILLFRKQTGDIVWKIDVGVEATVLPEERVGGGDISQFFTPGNHDRKSGEDWV
jgi:hypothetical protein